MIIKRLLPTQSQELFIKRYRNKIKKHEETKPIVTLGSKYTT